MEVYCNSCQNKMPMGRIRKPKAGRLIALLFLLMAIVSLFAIKSWAMTLSCLVLALILAIVGTNYWECESCGGLTERL